MFHYLLEIKRRLQFTGMYKVRILQLVKSKVEGNLSAMPIIFDSIFDMSVTNTRQVLLLNV